MILDKDMSYEDFEKKMLSEGWKKRIFDPEKEYSYKSWYYRIKKKGYIINHMWHIKHPEIIWWKSPNKELKDV